MRRMVHLSKKLLPVYFLHLSSQYESLEAGVPHTLHIRFSIVCGHLFEDAIKMFIDASLFMVSAKSINRHF